MSGPSKSEAQRTFERADQVIQWIHFRIIRIKSDAREFIGQPEKISLAGHIGNLMSDYQEKRDLQTAQGFLRAIDMAYSYDLIEEGESLSKKFEECSETNVKLQKELRNAQLENERLRKLVRLLGGNPDKTDDSLSSDVMEGGDSPNE